MGLRELVLPAQMSKGSDDIAADFYLPAMRNSIAYDRVAGYFSSGIYLIAWPELRRFAERGGRIRIICSPSLSRPDVDSLELGYRARDDDELSQTLLGELNRMLADDRLVRPARALAGLVSAGIVDVRLAFIESGAPAPTKRIFHDKVGVFRDLAGDRVGFRGTMNETYLGLATDGNLESIDIFPSWVDGRDAARLADADTRFDELWSGRVNGVSVRRFPDVVLGELRRLSREISWEVLADELAAESSVVAPVAEAAQPSSPRPPLRRHQIEALTAWEANGCRGILEHATGSGKTATAIEAIRRRLWLGETPIVVVPSDLLLNQWARCVREQLTDISPRILLCGGGHDNWRDDRLLRAWTRPGGSEDRIVIAVVNTAVDDAFRDALRGSGHLFLVGDEAHRLGSQTFRRVFEIDAQSRLGLSATPTRAGDPVGTRFLTDFFGGVVHRYGLSEAIRDGYLTPYTYHPHTVSLTEGEQDEWSRLSLQIRRRYGRVAGAAGADAALADDRLKLLLIQRSRIAKGAAGKVDLAGQVLSEAFEPGQRWLVYCDSQRQLVSVLTEIWRRGLGAIEYHSAMTGSQSLTLREFEVNGGIVVAIRCLDEGVDIPNASHALVLASSRNPREFIQRRGRVLRLAPGKTLSHVHDALVIPRHAPAASVPDEFEGALWAELARAMNFANSAINSESRTAIERICMDLDLDIRGLDSVGFEIDGSDEALE